MYVRTDLAHMYIAKEPISPYTSSSSDTCFSLGKEING